MKKYVKSATVGFNDESLDNKLLILESTRKLPFLKQVVETIDLGDTSTRQDLSFLEAMAQDLSFLEAMAKNPNADEELLTKIVDKITKTIGHAGKGVAYWILCNPNASKELRKRVADKYTIRTKFCFVFIGPIDVNYIAEFDPMAEDVVSKVSSKFPDIDIKTCEVCYLYEDLYPEYTSDIEYKYTQGYELIVECAPTFDPGEKQKFEAEFIQVLTDDAGCKIFEFGNSIGYSN